MVLELVPAPLAKLITERTAIPTIGIGAGADCDGQVLVCYDLLGMNPGFQPRFVKKFADLASVIGEAVGRYREEVNSQDFPAAEHTFSSEAGKPVEKQAVGAPVLQLYSVPGKS